MELTKDQRVYYKAIYENAVPQLLKGSQAANMSNLRNVVSGIYLHELDPSVSRLMYDPLVMDMCPRFPFPGYGAQKGVQSSIFVHRTGARPYLEA